MLNQGLGVTHDYTYFDFSPETSAATLSVNGTSCDGSMRCPDGIPPTAAAAQ
jgi:hypothetical protein